MFTLQRYIQDVYKEYLELDSYRIVWKKGLKEL
jgi:hypothetical protein